MYGGYYSMGGMPFNNNSNNNMRPMLGSMYQIPLMPSQTQQMGMQPQPTPFYNPNAFNVNNTAANNNNLSLYNLNTRNMGGGNAERRANAMGNRNSSNLSNPMPGSGYGSFFGAAPPPPNRTNSNISSIGVRSLPRINSGVNFNYSYGGYDNSYSNASNDFSNTQSHNNNRSNNNLTAKPINNNNNVMPGNRTNKLYDNCNSSSSDVFNDTSLIRYNSQSHMAPVQSILPPPPPQRNLSNVSSMSRTGSMNSISLANLPPSYYNLNSFNINVNEPSTHRISGTNGGSFSHGLPGMSSGVTTNGSQSSFYSETGNSNGINANNNHHNHSYYLNSAADGNTVNRKPSFTTSATSARAASFAEPSSSFAASSPSSFQVSPYKLSINSGKGFISKANEINPTHPLERLDSSSALHRQFSIAGRFNEFQNNYNNNNNNYNNNGENDLFNYNNNNYGWRNNNNNRYGNINGNNNNTPLPTLSQRYGMYTIQSPSTSSSSSSSSSSLSAASTPFGLRVNEGNGLYNSLRGPRPSTLPNLSTHNAALSTRSQSMPLKMQPDNTFAMRNAPISEDMALSGTNGSLLPLAENNSNYSNNNNNYYNNNNMTRLGFQGRMTNVPVLPSSSTDRVGNQPYSHNFMNNINNGNGDDNGGNKIVKEASMMPLGRSGSLLNFCETESMPLPNANPLDATTNTNEFNVHSNIDYNNNSGDSNNRFAPLRRTSSEKRVGMYFKNVEASNTDDKIQYKKEGDVVDDGKRTSRIKDASLTNNIKPLLLLATSSDTKTHFSSSTQENLQDTNVRVEVDGRTLRISKNNDTGHENFTTSSSDADAEEITKYDMREIVSVNRESDVEVSCEALDEVRDAFAYGCNGGLIMADSNGPGAQPTQWFTWVALKSLMKAVFARTTHTPGRELSMSVCLIQDDVVMDLLADEPRSFIPLVVAESPLFGNVVNGAEYLYIDDAAEFNDTLDLALERAEKAQAGNNNISISISSNSSYNNKYSVGSSGQESAKVNTKGDDGIVVVICVLKQLKTLKDDEKDVVISSLFASGVGDGILHYARIMDKNPAEPRQLFYSAMHRSVHCLGMFSCNEHEADFVEYIQVLNRLGQVDIRPPKTGSTASFVRYSRQSIAKMEEDIDNAKDPRQKLMMQRYLDKLRLMLSDAEFMLLNPESAMPKTYI